MRKTLRIAGLILVLALVYLIVGAIAPFIRYSEVTEDEYEQMYTMDSFAQASQTDRAMLLEDNTTALTERLRLMNQAKEDIVMTIFDMRDGESARDIAALLYEKAQEGVRVRILVDGMNTLVHMEGKEVFYALASHPNIEIRGYNNLNLLEPWKTQGRMHDKYVIVDNIAYIAGGRNTYDYFLGDYAAKSKSLDREVLIYNAAEMTQEDTQNNAISSTQDSSLYELRSYFEGVWSLDICSPFHESQGLAEQEKVRTMIAELRERYQTLYEYDGGISTHGKSVVIDQDVSVIGSYNMDLRSTYMDTELMVAVKSPELAAQLTGYMDSIQVDSREVLTKDTYDDPEQLSVQSVSG